MELSDSEANLDRFSAAQSRQLMVAQVDTSFEEEEEIAINPRRGLRDLVAGRKGGTIQGCPKDSTSSQSYSSPFAFSPRLASRPKLAKEEEEGKRDQGRGVCPIEGPKTTENEQRETDEDFDGE